MLLLWLFPVLLLLLPEIWVAGQSRGRCFRHPRQLPDCNDALVLGTAKYLASGNINAYYQHRIDAALALWHAGKVHRFVVSGNGLDAAGLSETQAMRDDLIAGGVPADAIWQDSCGLRTLDSVVRYAEGLWQPPQRLCVVSQPFHNRRALVLAAWQGVDAVALDADKISLAGGWRVQLRERAARWRLLWDVCRRTRPRHDAHRHPIQPAAQKPDNALQYRTADE